MYEILRKPYNILKFLVFIRVLLNAPHGQADESGEAADLSVGEGAMALDRLG